MEKKPCVVCGGTAYLGSYAGPTGKRMNETGECYSCAHWALRAAASDRSDEVVIEGWMYTIGAEPSEEARRYRPQDYGMSGRRFDIEFLTGPHAGEKYTTHSLWSVGEIPAHFRSLFPDTARFLNGAASVQVSDDPDARTTHAFEPSNRNAPSYETWKTKAERRR